MIHSFILYQTSAEKRTIKEATKAFYSVPKHSITTCCGINGLQMSPEEQHMAFIERLAALGREKDHVQRMDRRSWSSFIVFN